MIEKKFKTNAGKIKVCIPSTLEEITIGQMMQLQDDAAINDLEAIRILSGVPLEELQNIQNFSDLQIFSDTILSLSFQIRYLYNTDAIPKQISFNTSSGGIKKISVFNNLSVEPAGAFMAAREVIANEVAEHIKQYGEDDWEANFKPSLTACCQVLAHYFYCRVTGKLYNEYEAENFVEEVKKLRVTEALPISRHFFTCYPALSIPKTGCLPRLLQRLKNAQAFIRSKDLNISIP